MKLVFESIARELKVPVEELISEPLAGDASSRRFFRLTLPEKAGSRTAVLVVFPPQDRDGTGRYCRIGDCLKEAGLPVPELLRRNIGEGWLLAEDCGDLLLQAVAGRALEREIEPLYRQAIDLLVLMQEKLRPEDFPGCPALEYGFDEKTFLRELVFFLDYTVEEYYGRKIAPSDREEFRKLFLAISRESLSQPRSFCHRDYHSRNLLVREGKVRIIDFQDARLGPYTYDLVSLLHDPYVTLSDALKETLKDYFQRVRAEAIGGIEGRNLSRDCDIMTVQRILKAAGTYGYLAVEKGKKGYVGYLPAALKTVKDILRRYPEFSKLRSLLEKYLPDNPGT